LTNVLLLYPAAHQLAHDGVFKATLTLYRAEGAAAFVNTFSSQEWGFCKGRVWSFV